MTRPEPRLLLLAVALLGLTTSARAHTGETGGIGGTGVTSESGGIGGTGIRPSGAPILGYGPIQRFGSVFVNGREYVIDAHTRVTIDGVASRTTALRLGDVAQVLGVTTTAHGGEAREIAVIHAVIGPVTRISADGRQAVILGQAVQAVPGAALFAQARPGETLAVSAQRAADGVWHASAVTPAAAGRFQIVAPLAAVSPTQVGVSGLVIGAPAGLTAHWRTGEAALVSGTVTDGTLHADTLAPAPGLTAPAGTLVEAQDYFRSAGDDRIEAPDGLTATGAAPALSGQDPVEIIGTLAAPDVVDIDDVDLDTPSPADEVEPAHEEPDVVPDLPELPDDELLEHGKPDD